MNLKWPHPLAGSLDFHEGHTTTGEKNHPIRHPIQSRRYKFRSEPTTLFYLGDEPPLDYTFSQNEPPVLSFCSEAQKSYTRV